MKGTRLGENDDLPLKGALVVKKKPPFSFARLITSENIRSKDPQSKTSE